MNRTSIKPLFIWAGGKSKMLKYYEQYFPQEITKYIEPFFGGGSTFLYVMEKYKPKNVIINDINKDIMRIYKCIKTNLQDFIHFCKKLEDVYIPLTKDDRKKYYYDIRNEYAYNYETMNNIQESATLYFLMKTGFNGIYQINKNTNNRYGTPSGLLKEKNNVFLYDNIQKWSQLLQNVIIKSSNWKDSIPSNIKKCFLFFDPPYRGCFTSYGQSFDDTCQKELLSYCENIDKSNKIFLCNRYINDDFYSNTPLKHIIIPVTYTAGRRKRNIENDSMTFSAKKASEILLYN